MSANLFNPDTEGIFYDVPAEDYHKAPGLSHSMMKHLRPTPAHLVQYLSEPHEPSAAQRLGTMAHSLVLEPEKELPVIVTPPAQFAAPADHSLVKKKTVAEGDMIDWSWSANYCKAWRQNQERKGRIVQTQKEYEALVGMVKSIAANKLCNLMFKRGRAEVSIFNKDPITGVLLKGRLDFDPDGNSLVDIKTTEDASEYAFAKTIGDYRYHSQFAHYLDLYNAAAGSVLKTCAIIIAVEKNPPYLVATYTIDPEDLAAGRVLNMQDTATYAECAAKKEWPGYPVGFVPIRLPAWRRNLAVA